MRTPPRILIVDDQPMNVDILKTRLAVHGYELLTATAGAEALAIASAQQRHASGGSGRRSAAART